MKIIYANITQETLRAKNEHRDTIELLRSRVNLLSGRDKLLMTMYMENGNSFRQMARLLGINDRWVSRRIRRLIQRLLDNRYIICIRYRDRFTTDQLAIAKDYFLHGLSIKKVARKKGRSYYHIREAVKQIQQLVKAIEIVEGPGKPAWQSQQTGKPRGTSLISNI